MAGSGNGDDVNKGMDGFRVPRLPFSKLITNPDSNDGYEPDLMHKACHAGRKQEDPNFKGMLSN